VRKESGAAGKYARARVSGDDIVPPQAPQDCEKRG
jgi:hypothetical protein